MIRRLLRAVGALGVLGGLGFALVKLVQGRRSSPAGMPSGDEPVVAKRSETPLVEPKMFNNLKMKTPDEAAADVEETPRAVGPQAPSVAAAAAKRAADAKETAAPDAAPAEAPAPAAEPPAAAGPQHWVDPDGAICPTSHPVKAKVASGIFHLPGMTAYERTTPDRCYPDEASAEADGLRKAKR